ncbi:hypothetical protein GUJ93_ZPchr0011g26911 [Zizania palustris]|uniref:Uncharacterized protein n=1 Tax=Zizania palustris TaxID=103762 RepID=A0A8J5WMG8_ZIZPA|nr:hypothetical protein GUJ93_ZPchr0011g26911 [Zizania palustris]
MEVMEERVLEAVTTLKAKVEGIDLIQEKLMQIDFKLELQRERMDQMQTVVNQVQLEQATTARSVGTATGGAHARDTSGINSPGVIPVPAGGNVLERDKGPCENYQRRWVPPKIDLPKFDGTYARVWIDHCLTYLEMYQVPEQYLQLL